MNETFDFVPFDSPPPDGGVEIAFEVPNPDYAAELAEYRAALERNPFATDDVLETFTAMLPQNPDELVDGGQICVETTELTLVVGYPFDGQYAVAITATSPQGFTRGDLFRQLVRVYRSMYEGSTAAAIEHLENMHVTSPRFGEAFHVLEDLALEGVLLEPRADGRVFAWVWIGS